MNKIKFRYIIKWLDSDQSHYAEKDVWLTNALYFSLNELERGEIAEQLKEKYYPHLKIMSRNLYSGLKDKNGKEIYEGDIVKVCREDSFKPYIAKVYFVCGGFFTEWYFRMEDRYMAVPIHAWAVEIIGNITENPGLIKEKEVR